MLSSQHTLSERLLDQAADSETYSPLPPSASKTGLDPDGRSVSHEHLPPDHRTPFRETEKPRGRQAQQRPTSWPTAASHGLPIALMNLGLCHVYAQLICKGTPLEPAFVAAMHIFGSIVVQSFLLLTSGVAPFAIAAPDVTVALLSHAAVLQIYESGEIPEEHKAETALAALGV